MEYRSLGRTGLKVSALSFGAWVTFGNQIQVKEAKVLLQRCYDAGVNFFDNAEVYADGRAEEIMGQAIKELGWNRTDLVISTKLFWGGKGPNDRGLSRKHILEGIAGSLRRLQMDYVDVLFCHRPDPSTPIEETVRAMNYVIDKGQTFYWGTSEWSEAQITEAWGIAQRLGLQGPACEQPEYNLFERRKVEREFLPLYKAYGLGLTTWSPLASGVLSGKYTVDTMPDGARFSLPQYKALGERKMAETVISKVDAMKPIAAELGCSVAQLSLAWCLKNPHVSTVITGASKEQQVIDNMGALSVVSKLTPEVLDKIDNIMGTTP